MGYQEIAIENGIYQLVTVTFKEIAAEKYNIQNIRVVDENGAEFTTANRVKVQFIDETKADSGTYGTIYNWRKTTSGGIGWHQGSTPVGDAVKIGSGQAMVVNNTSGKTLYFRVSGEVALNPQSIEIASSTYQVVGNMTPVNMDIQDVVPVAIDESSISNNRIKFQMIDPEKADSGTYGTIYNWRKTTSGGTSWHQGSTPVGRNAITLKPGEGMVVNNGHTQPIVLKFKSPVAAE